VTIGEPANLLYQDDSKINLVFGGVLQNPRFKSLNKQLIFYTRALAFSESISALAFNSLNRLKAFF
jgi:hypothetical protein